MLNRSYTTTRTSLCGHTRTVLALVASLALLGGCGGGGANETAADFDDSEGMVTVLDYQPMSGTTGGSSDASSATVLNQNSMVVADDEANILRIYPRTGGAAVAEWDFSKQGPMLANEADLESSATLGDTTYFLGSLSNKKDGSDAVADRSYLFGVNIWGAGADAEFEYVGKFSGLEGQLIAWDTSNAHGLGAGYFGFAASAAAGVLAERIDGFSIEGMAVAPSGGLWLGMRAPLASAVRRDKALIVPLRNPQQLIEGTASQADFGTPIEIDLGGRGIRSIDRTRDGNYLIVAGPAGAPSSVVDRNFALFSWNGDAASVPVELDNDLDALSKDTGGSFESIVDVEGPLAAGTPVQLLLDNGDTIWPGASKKSSSLKAADQHFQGMRFRLGAPLTGTQGPVLKAASPATGTENVNVESNIVLTFNEGVRLGSGVIELHKADGTLVETFSATSSADRARVQFNVLTLDPTSKLESSTGYYLRIESGAVVDHRGNAYAGFESPTDLAFTSLGGVTRLEVGDVLFMGANTEAPGAGQTSDGFAFVLLKDVNRGTQITFTDRDYNKTTGKFPISESLYSWGADRDLPAGTIVTIQTSPTLIADKGILVGEGGGVGKSETVYALQDTTFVFPVTPGKAGDITTVGRFLASITVGGAAGDIPQELIDAGTAMSFTVSPAKETNAIYIGSLDRSDLAAFAQQVKNSANWNANYTKKPGFPFYNGSLFPTP